MIILQLISYPVGLHSSDVTQFLDLTNYLGKYNIIIDKVNDQNYNNKKEEVSGSQVTGIIL